MERFRSQEIILREREELVNSSSFFQSLCIELETHREIAFSFGYVYWPRSLTLTLISRVTTLRFRYHSNTRVLLRYCYRPWEYVESWPSMYEKFLKYLLRSIILNYEISIDYISSDFLEVKYLHYRKRKRKKLETIRECVWNRVLTVCPTC